MSDLNQYILNEDFILASVCHPTLNYPGLMIRFGATIAKGRHSEGPPITNPNPRTLTYTTCYLQHRQLDIHTC